MPTDHKMLARPHSLFSKISSLLYIVPSNAWRTETNDPKGSRLLTFHCLKILTKNATSVPQRFLLTNGVDLRSHVTGQMGKQTQSVSQLGQMFPTQLVNREVEVFVDEVYCCRFTTTYWRLEV